MGSAQSGKISAAAMEGRGNHNDTSSSGLHRFYECRHADHAGSWYSDNREQLQNTLERFICHVDSMKQKEQHDQSSSSSSTFTPIAALRAIICPHAGYSYSGQTAAYSYHALLQELIRSQVDRSGGCKITQIVVLHPSHHVPLRGKCAISGANVIATPIGNLQVDSTLRDEIIQLSCTDDNNKTYDFTIMTQKEDEMEHSGEMQYPFIVHVLQRAAKHLQANKPNHNDDTLHQITVTPIMCGSLTVADEIAYGTLLSDLLHRPHVLTVVSTDFCHWGRRFGYQPAHVEETSSDGQSPSSSRMAIPIYQVIQQLDRRGMDLIEAQEPGAFASYLRETNNTICGRHAIAVWLRAVKAITTSGSRTTCNTEFQESESETIPSNDTSVTDQSVLISSTTPDVLLSNQYTVQFIHYEQSSRSKAMSDSSVSYAAAIATTGM